MQWRITSSIPLQGYACAARRHDVCNGFADVLPRPGSHVFLATEETPLSPSSAGAPAIRCRPAVQAPADRHRGRTGRLRKPGDFDTGQIGTFTKSETGFTGAIPTLALKADVSFERSTKENEKSPDFRLRSNGIEIGAAWAKTSREGLDYISCKFDDRAFPIRCLQACMSQTMVKPTT